MAADVDNLMHHAHGDSSWETSWQHTWPWPPWVSLLVLLVCAAIILGLYFRERGNAGRGLRYLLVTARLLVIMLVLFMLYGWTRQQHRADLPELIICIDDSASMNTVDAFTGDESQQRLAQRLAALQLTDATRLNRTRLLLLENDASLLRALRNRYRLRWYWIGDTVREWSLPDSATVAETGAEWAPLRTAEAKEPASRLGQNLLEILHRQRARPTAALVLISDGITTDGPSLQEAAQAARRKQIPLFCLSVGSNQAPLDVALSDLLVDDLVFVNDLLHFDARLVTTGCAGRTVTVRLRRADSDAILAEQRVTITRDGESAPVRLSTRPRQEGRFEYFLSVESPAGEANTANNRLAKTISVTEQSLRVLLVQASPSYDYRFLATLLGRQLNSSAERDAANGRLRIGGEPEQVTKTIELATVLQDADPEHAQQDQSAHKVFPTTREELFRYDVVIFGDVDPTQLGASAPRLLAEFVTERGGGLVVLAGPSFTPCAYRETPLADLLPVSIATATAPAGDNPTWTAFRPRLTALGRATPMLQLADQAERNEEVWRNLPPWYWFIETPDLRSGARVLLEHPSRTDLTGRPLPLVSVQFVGAGKVVFQATDDGWRWSRDAAGDMYYARYWLQMLRYLGRSKRLQGDQAISLTTDREEYRQGEPVLVRVRFADERAAPADDVGATVIVQRDGGGQRSVQLHRDSVQRGRFEGTFRDAEEGRFRVWLASPVVAGEPVASTFSVRAPLGEQARLAVDVTALTAAATTSEGRYEPLERIATDEWLRSLPAGSPVRIESLPPEPIWNWWPIPLLFVLLLTTEWILRRRAGML